MRQAANPGRSSEGTGSGVWQKLCSFQESGETTWADFCWESHLYWRCSWDEWIIDAMASLPQPLGYLAQVSPSKTLRDNEGIWRKDMLLFFKQSCCRDPRKQYGIGRVQGFLSLRQFSIRAIYDLLPSTEMKVPRGQRSCLRFPLHSPQGLLLQ